MFRSRNWFGGGFWKSRNPHSLEHLKYLYNILSKNQTVSDNNRGLLIETLRSIAEILIWGDQNDSSVFDFFLEKNMLSFFLRIMIQKCGSYVCVQLLQTLNILFENIRNETSLYYLLSNNHVNSIIVHKFDFSDEEVMAYYISFLKTLSFKLNAHTIHFFYNEHTNDFPLYTEAIKFFNHSEGMVRIAVRTLTLNVYRVKDVSMLKFIRDRTAAPYFSNLVWFIGNHIIELDICVRNDADHQNQNRLSDLLAEHLDHLHYLNDILCLNIEDLNMVLSEHLLHKLFFPLYLYSLIRPTDSVCDQQGGRKSISTVVALFLLSQIFLIISYEPLVRTLASVLLKHNIDIKSASCRNSVEIKDVVSKEVFNFIPPKETLEKSLENLSELKENCMMTVQDEKKYKEAENSQTIDYLLSSAGALNKKEESLEVMKKTEVNVPIKTEIHREINNSNKTVASEAIEDIKHLSVTDEEKEQRLALENPLSLSITYATSEKELFNESFLKRIFTSMHCTENDYAALFALCLLYALLNNQGIHSEALTTFLLSVEVSLRSRYKETLIDRIVHIITLSCHTNAKIRLVTLELAIKLLIQLVIPENNVFIQDYHLEALETVKELSTMLLRNFFKSEDIFLDMFEDEYAHIQKKTLKVEWLMMDSNILLPPTGTPMTGIEFSKRLPCGEVERVRRAIRIFFLIRKLSLLLNNKVETQLPLTNSNSDIQVNNVLDLNNSDLIACTVISKDEQRIRRFLVIDCTQLILVEPDTRKLGWGVAKFVGFLQDIEVISDKEDSRSLNLMIRKPLHNTINKKTSLFSAKLIFDDHIRCMAAKQRLTKGRIKTRQRKISQIATLLCISTTTPHCSNTPSSTWFSFREDSRVDKNQKLKDQKRMFTINKVPGFATQTKYEILNIPSFGFIGPNFKPMDFILNDSKSHDLNIEFQDTSPKVSRGLNEEIPLENMQLCESSRVISSIEQGKSAGMQKKRSIDTKPKNSSEETSFTEKHTDNSRARNKGKVETV